MADLDLLPSHPTMKSTTTPINKNWSFTQLGGGEGTKDGEWLNCKHFPTSVHVELLDRKAIPDPVSHIYISHIFAGSLNDNVLYTVVYRPSRVGCPMYISNFTTPEYFLSTDSFPRF